MYNINKFQSKLFTTSLFVIFAATIPKVKIYNAGWFSNMLSVDFSDIIKAGITTENNGIIGDITLVP